MEFFRRYWTQISAHLSKLSPSQKWVIGFGLIILLLVGLIAVIFAGRPEMMSVSPFASAKQGEVVSALRAAGIDVQTTNGQVMVPPSRHVDALAILENRDLLAADTSAAFDEFVRNQSPWRSNAQNARAYLVTKAKVLGQIISKMNGVRSAEVILDIPEVKGFGSAHVRPSAAVSVVMQGSRRVSNDLGQSIAAMVSGAVAQMAPQDVRVIDAIAGRQLTIRGEDDFSSAEQLEQMQEIEQYHREKILALLSHQIPRVVVAVNVLIDDITTRQIQLTAYQETEPITSEYSREMQRTDTRDAGEPGARPNVGISIEGGGGAGRSDTTGETRNEYGPKQVTRQESTRHRGGKARQINVTVAVPRSYFVSLFKQANPGVTDEPNDAALGDIVTVQLAQIESQVMPLITAEADGVVKAHMYYDGVAGAAITAGVAQPGGMVALFDSSWMKTVGLGALALVSLAMMMGMVRKATQRSPMPSAEELAGVPPTLPTDEDLVGEADESDPSMAGVELNEEELRSRKIAEQIGEMVRANPSEAATLVGRWVRTEE